MGAYYNKIPKVTEGYDTMDSPLKREARKGQALRFITGKVNFAGIIDEDGD